MVRPTRRVQTERPPTRGAYSASRREEPPYSGEEVPPLPHCNLYERFRPAHLQEGSPRGAIWQGGGSDCAESSLANAPKGCPGLRLELPGVGGSELSRAGNSQGRRGWGVAATTMDRNSSLGRRQPQIFFPVKSCLSNLGLLNFDRSSEF